MCKMYIIKNMDLKEGNIKLNHKGNFERQLSLNVLIAAAFLYITFECSAIIYNWKKSLLPNILKVSIIALGFCSTTMHYRQKQAGCKGFLATNAKVTKHQVSNLPDIFRETLSSLPSSNYLFKKDVLKVRSCNKIRSGTRKPCMNQPTKNIWRIVSDAV